MEDIKFEKVPSGIFDKVKSNKEEFVDKFIDELEELFPDTVKDGKVDFRALIERFGEYEDRDEKYELTWVGKNKARQEAFEDIVGKTLKYVEKDSKNPDTTENLYIEGDNLEVLKLLRKSYYGKIKMIYIDPPYNTGNDFVYKDNFTMTKDEYEKLKGNVDEYGERLVKNSSDSGRYHSNWLNMMYPRLQVARDLLTDDGVVFISIANQEIDNLKKICDEILGDTNLLGIINWESKTKCQNTKTAKYQLQNKQEYILVYKKNEGRYEFNLKSIEAREYPSMDETGKGYRIEQIGEMSADGIRGRNSMIFSIEGVYPRKGNQWKYGIETINIFKERGDLFVENGKAYFRVREFDEEDRMEPFWSLIFKEIGTTETAKAELKSIIEKHGFETVKPVELIKKLIFHVSLAGDDAIILDFFSGSSTTAHAVMQLNAEDNAKQAGTGNRKFIMVQIPEPTDEKSEAFKADYKNICEIGKERIRRAGDKILEDNKDKEGIEKLDIGFKVFKVADTNFKRIEDKSDNIDITEYEEYKGKDAADFNPHFTDIDTVYELMLRRQDIKLTEEIKKLNNIGDRTYIVGDTMLVCLEEKITSAMVEEIGNINTDLSWIVLRDSAFDDDCELKINTTRMLRTIIKESKNKDQKIYWI